MRRIEKNLKDRSGRERKGCDSDGVAVARTVFPPCGGTVNCSLHQCVRNGGKESDAGREGVREIEQEWEGEPRRVPEGLIQRERERAKGRGV